MNMDIWIYWIIVSASAIFHMMATLILSAYPARSFTLSGTATENSQLQVDQESIRQINTPTRILIMAVQGISLLVGGLGVLAGLTDQADLLVRFFIAFGATISIRFLLHIMASYIAHRYRLETRRAMYPIVWASTRLGSIPGSNWLARRITGRTEGDETSGLEASEALKESLDLLEEDQIPANESELRMIRGILRMDTVKVRDIMRPRPDILAASKESRVDELANLMRGGGHSKIPLYDKNVDSIVGIVYSRDVLTALGTKIDGNENVSALARRAIHVPESQNLERLLREFQEHRTSIAMVVDEYGSVVGLVTVTDLIEEIVGELTDEFDVSEPEIQRINDTETVADAAVSIDLVNQTLGASLKGDGFGTLGGLVFKELGRIPAVGDQVRVNNLTIIVQSIVGRRIHRVKILEQS